MIQVNEESLTLLTRAIATKVNAEVALFRVSYAPAFVELGSAIDDSITFHEMLIRQPYRAVEWVLENCEHYYLVETPGESWKMGTVVIEFVRLEDLTLFLLRFK